MKHLSDGILRRMVDEPFAFSGEDRAHLAGCARCGERIKTIRSDEQLAAQALNSPVPSPELNRARAAISERRPSRRTPRLSPVSARMPRPIPAAALLVIAASLVTSVATGAAGDVLTVFHSGPPTPIYLRSSDLASLPALRNFGVLHVPMNVPSRQYGNAATAAAAAGMHVEVPASLPAGISASAKYSVVPGQTSSFTFSAAKAAAYAARSHQSVPRMPAAMNGSMLTLSTHTAVVAVYGKGGDVPDLVVAETKAPTLVMSGVTLPTVEDYLSRFPGLPSGLVHQIKQLASPTSTLPIPIPIDLAYANHVTVDGTPGLIIGDNTGVASVVVWEKAGVVYGVGGGLTASQALQAANSLR